MEQFPRGARPGAAEDSPPRDESTCGPARRGRAPFPACAPGRLTARSGFGFYMCEMGRNAHIATLLRVGAGIKSVKGVGNYQVDYKCR